MKISSYVSLLGGLACIILLLGCTEGNSPSLGTTSTSVTLELLETPYPALVTHTPPISTLIVPSSTHSPGPGIRVTATSLKTGMILNECISGREPVSPPGDFGIDGTLVYQTGNGEGFYTIGGTPLMQARLPISDTKVVPLGFSPDGNWLAYAPITQTSGDEIVFETPSIVLFSSAGVQIEYMLNVEQIQDELLGTLRSVSRNSYWINEQLMQITLLIDDNDPYSNDILLQKIYDPFQGVWVEELLQDLNNRTSNQVVGFSPDLTRVLYEATFGIHSHGITLWDVEQDSTLWMDQKFRYTDGLTLVHWSPDSSYVVVGNQGPVVAPEENQIVLVSRDGDGRTLADPTFPTKGFFTGSISWAPDGQQVAFVNKYQYETFEDGLPEIYIYDLLSEQYLLSCPLKSYQEFPPELIWSPDGAWIALSARIPGFPLQILNVSSGEIIELVDNATAIGWSDKFPTVWP